MIVIAALYHFARFPDPAGLRAPLLALARAQGVRGSILLAGEGINGTIAGPRAGIDACWRISAPCPAAPRWNGRKATPTPCPSAA
jgi:UPF0176 protein